ncbi:hypothetical protein ANASTE_00840 [Anaerofustis stercorihominis DSM 17244]|uniref:Uncharacterized protein n=1 Tax=Anaerofustis stercorihominis DSM 17244 TaxID=445971 RepID=B1C7Y6_9FIRM|nr:hypothetical protein ANASTE_00840 [Anaerofustis stercorihominis DSM 17244]
MIHAFLIFDTSIKNYVLLMFKFDLISIILEHKKYIEKSNISDILIIVPDFK